MAPKKAELTAELHLRLPPDVKNALVRELAEESKALGIKISLSQYVLRILNQRRPNK